MPNIPYIPTTATSNFYWSNSTTTNNYITYIPYTTNSIIPVAQPIAAPPPRNGPMRGSNYTAHYCDGVFHREDGPAIINDNGDYQWYIHGKRHREDGPALEIIIVGVKEWFANDKRHRIDGPAIERPERKEWWVKGKRHREDGPAIEYVDGYKEWYYHGRSVAVATQDAFNRYVVADKYL